MRKIIIIPSFASSHLLKCSIPNWIEVLEPDIIVINSGLFPEGPENKGHIDDEFRKKWCYKDTNAGFDFDETLQLTRKYRKTNHVKPNVFVLDCEYDKLGIRNANEAFLYAITKIFKIKGYCPEIGDILFPLEPDVLFHENDKEKIQAELLKLTPGVGLQCVWKDFLETQFYTELINEISPKWRRFAYCFDTIENYKNAMNAFMTQNYKSLRKVDDFFAFHYPWFQPEPWKQLRYELIWRKDPQYWKDFEDGLQKIREITSNYVQMNKESKLFGTLVRWDWDKLNKILIRPSRTDEARWAKFIDISHPKHISNHPNFVK